MFGDTKMNQTIKETIVNLPSHFKPKPHIRDFLYIPGGFSPRDAQVKACDNIEEAILHGFEYIIAQYPTGTGKSAIANAVLAYFGDGYVCTATKMLQEQYLRDFKDLVTVKGRANFQCLAAVAQGLDFTCDKGLCTCGFDECKRKPVVKVEMGEQSSYAYTKVMPNGVAIDKFWVAPASARCEYWAQKVAAIHAKAVTPNYTYLLYESNMSRELPRRKVLVGDECHNIENEIMRYIAHPVLASVVNTINKYSSYKLEFPVYDDKNDPDTNLNIYINWLDTVSPILVSALAKINTISYGKFGKKMSMLIDADEDGFPIIVEGKARSMTNEERREFDELKTNFRTLTFLKQRIDEKILREVKENKDLWAVVQTLDRDRKFNGIEFRPVKIAKYAKDYFFHMGKYKILMSATVLDAEAMADSLGIDPEEMIYLEEEPVFPKENHRIHELCVSNFSFVDGKDPMSDRNFGPAIVESIDTVLDLFAGERGIIHCTSYKIAQIIMDLSRNKHRFTIHNSMNREEKLAEHGRKEGSVLLSPSMTEGVDLKGRLSRFQILVKYPYPNTRDPVLMKRKLIDAYYIDYQIALTIIQSIGRSVRGPEDLCDTFVFDNRTRQLHKMKRGTSHLYTRHITNPDKLKEVIQKAGKDPKVFDKLTRIIPRPESKFKKYPKKKR
jgi:ATP-dependent DNA helicase DinG